MKNKWVPRSLILNPKLTLIIAFEPLWTKALHFKLTIILPFESWQLNHIALQWLEDNPRLLDNAPPFIAIPTVDENWGFLSSHFLNRTTGYHMTLALHKPSDRIPKNGQLEEVRPFLDHPKLLMLVTNQHMNITHPKVISLPIGFLGKSADELWPLARLAAKGHVALFDLSLTKSSLLLSAASDWGPRPSILQCVQSHMEGDTMHVLSSRLNAKVSRRQYSLHLLSSAAVLCLPGLGYDSYRVFEALLAGAMPVLERGIGLDRSWHKLPVSTTFTVIGSFPVLHWPYIDPSIVLG